MANLLTFDRSRISTVRDFDSLFSGEIKSIADAGVSKAGNQKIRITVITVHAVDAVEGRAAVLASGTGVRAVAAVPAIEAVAAVAEQTASGITMVGTFDAAALAANVPDAYSKTPDGKDCWNLDYFVGMKAERICTNEDSTDSIKPTQLTISVN